MVQARELFERGREAHRLRDVAVARGTPRRRWALTARTISRASQSAVYTAVCAVNTLLLRADSPSSSNCCFCVVAAHRVCARRRDALLREHSQILGKSSTTASQRSIARERAASTVDNALTLDRLVSRV